MQYFDISPFTLPNSKPGEYLFEEPHDINRIEITFKGPAPQNISLSYLQNTWPKQRFEYMRVMENPFFFGWFPIDDHDNSKWQNAAVELAAINERTVAFTFQGIGREFPVFADEDVDFRRTLGIKVDIEDVDAIEHVRIYTKSAPMESQIRVELDAGNHTQGSRIELSAYHAQMEKITTESGVKVNGAGLSLSSEGKRAFRLSMKHMDPCHQFSNDEGHITFALDHDTFTISLDALRKQGPIWFEEEGIYIALAEDTTTFEDYLSRIQHERTVADMVLDRREQSFGGAFNGQPRPHPVAYTLGCKHARQRFWLEPNGDILLHKYNVTCVSGKDTPRYKNEENARFFFALERWCSTGRFPDSAPVLAYNIHLKRDGLTLEQKSFAIPLDKPIAGELAGDDTMVAMLRFRITNTSDQPKLAELPIQYSQNSRRSHNRLECRWAEPPIQNDDRVPLSSRDKLSVSGAQNWHITSPWQDQSVLRCTVNSTMQPAEAGDGLVFKQELQPGETCEALVKIPYIALDSSDELTALSALDFDESYKQVAAFWREEGRRGTQLKTPEPHLNELYSAHVSHVQVTDFAMPDDNYLVNTSVGSSTYGNFTNESCMIVQEFDQRGLHDEARRRLSVWLKYQGKVGLKGNFTDHDGVFYGAGGFEMGETYNQHHGWVLWYLAQHYFATKDTEWLNSISDSLIKGADWVSRQRRHTMTDLSLSRGWEYGFLPSGSLEDVADYYYWLSTNSVTWRGVDSAASALEAINHPEAARIRAEADAYRRDLINGFEKNRQHSPLVRLRNGKWVPHYPSRLYRRGRDTGWIREILEGSVYLLISGLYDANSKQAKWILDDYQDNRYMNPPYGYPILDPADNWFDNGGLSAQPNLLAGLMPYLEIDEPEIYIWMFFNAWCACYREEINAMVEHPDPFLGYSNAAHFKTSDQANAVMWLRYMFVYATENTLYLGRAIPRQWLSDGQEIYAKQVSTRFGEASVTYNSQTAQGKITITADLDLTNQPKRAIARIRHPEKLPIKSVTVNGKAHEAFDPVRGDVDITGLNGVVYIEARY